MCRTGRGYVPDGTGLCAGRGLQPRPQCFAYPMCRTGFATPSAMFCISTKAKVSDGVANRAELALCGTTLYGCLVGYASLHPPYIPDILGLRRTEMKNTAPPTRMIVAPDVRSKV